MEPRAETCGELLRPLRALLGLKQVALQWANQNNDLLPPAAAGLLSELVHHGECRASELAQHRVVDASVVSRQVAQLESAGLITRTPAPDDRRVSLLRATPRGEQALDQLERQKSEWLRHALRGWEDREVRQLADLLQTASSDLREAAHELQDHSEHTSEEGTR